MAFNENWNESGPTDSTLARDIDNEIRVLKEAIRERLQEEHAFYEDESTHDDVGEHKKGSARIDFGTHDDRPSINSNNPGSLYVETDTLDVFYDNGTEWIDIMQVSLEYTDTHEEKVSGVHGVGSSDVESTSGAQSKVDTHEDKDNPHSDSASNTELSSHTSDNDAHHTRYTNEEVEDTVDSLLDAGTNIDLTYDDNNNTLTISSITDEEVEDIVGALIVGGTDVTINYDDTGNTLTISFNRYTDSEAVTAINNEDSLSVDSDSVDGYDIEKNGTDGEGVINFKT